jgi:hypothetical protein
MKTTAAVVFMLAACSASIPPPRTPVAPAKVVVRETPKPEAKPTKLELELGGEAFAFQSGGVVMRLHRDGRVEGVVGRSGLVQIREDGTLTWDGTPAVRITSSGLVKLATNQSLAIELDASGTKIKAGNFRFELEPDGTLVAHSVGAVDRTVKIEGDPAARRTLFVVLVYTLMWSKVDAAAMAERSTTTSA